MASSSSHSFVTIHSHETIEKLNDAVYELYKPASGSINLEIVFFHGFQSKNHQKLYVETWIRLSSLLSKTFSQSRILSVSYDSSIVVSDSEGRMDMYVIGENLATSIVELAGVGRACPVLLVAHCVGGLVLKEVCCRAEKRTTKSYRDSINPYSSFLRNVKGAFFISTSQLGSRIQPALKLPGPLVSFYKLHNSEIARLNADFSELRKRFPYAWKTWGIAEANETEDSKAVFSVENLINVLRGGKRPRSLLVEEGSARYDMDKFCILPGEDNESICKPKDQNSSSFQLIEEFVKCILENEEWAKKQWRLTLQFPRLYLSMPHRVEEVIRRLELDQADPSVMYLVGMGGIGKSTLAKEVLVQIGSQFEFVGFVEDVGGRLKQQDHNLATLVARDLYHGNGSKVMLDSRDPGQIWLLLRGKKVILIMDNVDLEEQIGSLLEPDWVGKGSRLIITSRERPSELKHFVIHEVPLLSREESTIFFQAHLDNEVAGEISRELIDRVVAKCDGLPLTLEVIGSSLRMEKDVGIWNQTLDSLRKAESIEGSADDRLWAKLKVSMDNLAPRERSMFLDLAVYDKCESDGVWYDLHLWRAVWHEGVHPVRLALRNLENKCLVRIIRRNEEFLRDQTSKTKLRYFPSSPEDPTFARIHEQLRDMAKSICRRSDEGIELWRRVWRPRDICNLFAKNKGENDRTETLSVNFDQFTSSNHFRWSSIGQMKNLRLLRMSNGGLMEGETQRYPSELSLLHMRSCFREKESGWKQWRNLLGSDCWPIRVEDVEGLRKMTVVIMEKCLSVRLPSNFHKLVNLRILIIREAQLEELPKKFGLLPSLQVLLLEGVGLSRIPDSFNQLLTLQNFTLSGCPTLQSLPDRPLPIPVSSKERACGPLNMLEHMKLEDLPILECLSETTLGQLVSLKTLILNRCHAISMLPESFGQLKTLELLDMYGCTSLSMLPESFGQLKSLEILHMDGCTSLSMLPESFGQMKTLQWLDMRGCTSLSMLPESFGQMKTLQWLDMRGCSSLSMLPESFGQLKSLEILYMRGCTSLSMLPESFGQLKSLEILHMDGCTSLSMLPESFGQMKTLQWLDMRGCSSLSMLPESFGQLKTLEQLDMRGCSSLSMLPESFGQMKTLQWLDMRGCSSLSMLPESFGQLKTLEQLDMRGCSSLSMLPESFGQLKSLEVLDMRGCSSLSMLPESFGQLKSLEVLDMDGCTSLSMLPESFGQLKSLKVLDMDGCTSLSMLPESFGELKSLCRLHMDGCTSLSMLPESFGELKSLELLDMYGCTSLSMLPESFGQLKSLEVLDMDGCTSLSMLPESFGQLKSLKVLDMDGCTSLSMLPESFGELKSLCRLHMDGCTSLSMLPESFGELKSLWMLHMEGCSSLSMLPESFGQLKSLELLDMYGCTSLSMLPESFGELKSLELLDMYGCTSLSMLPESFGELKSLRWLDMEGCSSLSMLPESFGQLKSLKVLDMNGCTSLSMPPKSFGKLKFLRVVGMEGCSSLSMPTGS